MEAAPVASRADIGTLVEAAVSSGLLDDFDLPDMRALVSCLLENGAATAWEIARSLDIARPGLLHGREGLLYPLLAEMTRDGSLAAAWRVHESGAPCRLYAVSRDHLGPESDPPPVEHSTELTPIEQRAEDVSRGIRGAMARASTTAEIRDHLERSRREYLRMGFNDSGACNAALKDLGEPWKIRTDLGRVYRGRSVVVFPRTLSEKMRSLAIYDLGPAIIAVALVLLVRWQVVQAYNIPTTSMSPTLHGDEEDPDYIVVNKLAYLMAEPERWDIIVFHPPRSADQDDPSAFVKRCVGMGGETLDIRAGDVWIDGHLARRPLGVEDAMMVPLYDLDHDVQRAALYADGDPLDEWLLDGYGAWDARSGDWSVRGNGLHAVPVGGEEAWLEFVDDDGITNRHYLPDGTIATRSSHVVGDAEVRFSVQVEDENTVAGADLTEGNDRHSLRIGHDGVTVTSRGRTWHSPLGRTRPGKRTDVHFRNVDDRITVRVNGEMLLREELPDRGLSPVDAEEAGVLLTADRGGATFSRVRVLRDVHYMRVNRNGPWEPRRIPEGHLFMMGDNTDNSNDSRMWGTVDRREVIGSPFIVILPISRAKVLK